MPPQHQDIELRAAATPPLQSCGCWFQPPSTIVIIRHHHPKYGWTNVEACWTLLNMHNIWNHQRVMVVSSNLMPPSSLKLFPLHQNRCLPQEHCGSQPPSVARWSHPSPISGECKLPFSTNQRSNINIKNHQHWWCCFCLMLFCRVFCHLAVTV